MTMFSRNMSFPTHPALSGTPLQRGFKTAVQAIGSPLERGGAKRRGVLGVFFVGLCLFALAWPTLSRAQTVRWDPPGGQLGFNQVAELSLIFEDCEPDGEIPLPKVNGLNFGRPSQSSQTSIVNFKMSRTFSFVFPVRAETRSPLTIPAFDVKTDKGVLPVKAARFSVGDATLGNSGLAVDDIVALKVTTPRDTFWAGEVFPVSYNLNIVRRYLHSPASNVEWQPAPLVAEDWSKLELSETLLRGERYALLSQNTRAYAKSPGNYTIKPASQMLNFNIASSGFAFLPMQQVEQRKLESNPLSLTIKPLPAAPLDFSGAVGEFTFTSKVVPTAAAVGEPVTWTITLGGTGNWPDISGLPSREVSNDFQVVQPKSKRTMKDGALFEGTLSEDVVLVPSRPGTYRLAPVRFTYFDTRTGTYRTIASEPVTVTITAGAAPAPAPAGAGAPVQFSLNPPPSSAPAAPVLPAAVPPVPPENLPRDPIAESATGFVPLPPRNLAVLCLLSSVLCVAAVWLILATLRSRQNDPERLRRAARARLAAALADLRLPGDGQDKHRAGSSQQRCHDQLRVWQTEAAALWEMPHAAPGTPLVHACVGARSRDAASGWARLWSEADRALHSRDHTLPKDWMTRAEGALQAVKVPGWPPFSIFAGRNLLPFIYVLLGLYVLWAPPPALAATPADSYKQTDFPAAEAGWRSARAAAPADWTARHNLGLALAQQDRWAEATAYWTGAFLLNARGDATRWDLALGLQRSGMAPPELVELSRGEGRARLVRLATPGEWQLALVGAALLLAAALIVLLLQGYRHIGPWGRPVALTACLLAMLLAAAATFSLHTYGALADPEAALVWKPSLLRSIPTEADTTQKTSPLSAGSIAVVEKTFLGWSKLNFTAGQSGWIHTEDLIRLYR